MRPAILYPLFKDVGTLKGVGPNMKAALSRLLAHKSPLHAQQAQSRGPVIRDMLFHLPSGVIDRRTIYKLADIPVGQVATAIVTIQSHHAPPKARGRKLPYRVICGDDTGDMILAFFNARADYLSAQLPIGKQCIISGVAERYDGVLQIAHPDVIAPPDKLNEVATLEPNYPLTYALGQKHLRKLILQALQQCPDLTEWLDNDLLLSRNWEGWKQSLQRLHKPDDVSDIALDSSARQRLAYDEILAHQLALAMLRKQVKRKAGIIIPPHVPLREQLIAQLPFTLTDGQRQVLYEMDADMQSGDRMLRLLQGDVGSGKTIVALLAMLSVIGQGYQAALMVPTEILGRQHLATIRAMVEPLGLRVAMLHGKIPAKERKELLADMASGAVHITIGTHALFQQSVAFAKLGIVVIDEQHRFGVEQRLALSAKGDKPHILLMTATPIPRSLTMTAYGDMDSSSLREKPAGRPRIDTRAIPLSRLDEVVEGLHRAIAGGSKIYWICPLVDEPDPEQPTAFEGDLAAAEERHRVFTKIFGNRVALAHGKMKSADREASMQAFATDGADILVATTVVEVGVNVPEATIIVIEHAERFGLAQLHQLRGRVGRSDKASSCILLYNPRCSEVAKQRLKIIRESDDGFRIAEEDLILRGAGDVLGTRQSGLPDYYFVDLAAHRDLVALARDDVKLILHRDAPLASPRGENLRHLLYLFEYDSSLHYAQAG